MAKRNRFTRILLWLLAAACVTAVVLVAVTRAWLQSTVAPLEGEYTIDGLDGPVIIRFDAFARPFVEAETFADALFAEGWLHASHRLWQMELLRRAGNGRMAQLLGAGLLATDEELWRRGVPPLALQLEANASGEMKACIEAYVNGINAALDAGVAQSVEMTLLGMRPARWKPLDAYAVAAVTAYQSANNADNELLRLAIAEDAGAEAAQAFFPDGHNDVPTVIPANADIPLGVTACLPARAEAPSDSRRGHTSCPWRTGAKIARLLDQRDAADPLAKALVPSFAFGSNGWVVAPARAKDGHALFAFDSHDALGLPNLFYEVHLYFAEGRELHGWSVAGLPGVVNGYNERIAWGFTNIGDTQDCFLETRSPEGPLRFKDGDTWYEAETETAEIPVKGREEPVMLTLVHTKNGTLISDDPPIALRWSAQELGGMGIDSLLRLNLARNWEEFNDALDALPAPALNATYADVDGNIGFRTVGRFPMRGQGEGLVPLDGADSVNRWRGFVDPNVLPRRFNPPEGFIAAANARVNAPGNGPLISADNAPGYRIRRIQHVLSQRNDFTVDDMQALQMDWYDTQAALLLPRMLSSLQDQSLAGSAEIAFELLKVWGENPVAAPDASAPLVFQAWYRALAEEVFKAGLSPEVFMRLMKNNYVLNQALDRLVLRDHDSAWWRGERPAVLRAALGHALEEIAATQGENPRAWRLDRMHAVRLEHELGKAVPQLGWFFNAAPEPWGGSTSTVGRARYRYDRAYDVTAAATVRVAGEMIPTGPTMRAVMPGGQSGHPMSPHYLDQYPLWLQGRVLPIVDTQMAMRSTLTLKPL